MAGMTYTKLTGAKSVAGSIASWVNSSTIESSTPDIVSEAESWIYRRLRHWKMLTHPLEDVMTIGIPYIDSPDDLLEPFLLWTTKQYLQVMDMKTPQEVIFNWSYTSNSGTYERTRQQPMLYYQDETRLNFDSPPDKAYDYALIYFKQPEALSDSNETNFLTSTYPRLMRVACMAAAAEWLKDSGQGNYDRTYWDQVALDEIDKAQAESDRAKRATVAGMVLIGGGQSSVFPAYVTGY
jgi:hypothetical protein